MYIIGVGYTATNIAYIPTMVVNTTKSVQLLVQLIFIFGYVTAIFQNCQILVKQGNPPKEHYRSRTIRLEPNNWFFIPIL
jgi:hypothetical protein